MPEPLPPNTYDIDVRVRISLPGIETPEEQDITLLITGECYDPWPGVKIHDLELLDHLPVSVVDMRGREALSCWFGLGRATFLVLPRVLMEAMPEIWQRKMAALLHEYDAAFPNWPEGMGSRVQITQGGQLTTHPDWLTNYRHPDRAAIDALRG